MHDNGGVANGGVDTSAPQTFVIAVTAVNDAPVFAKGADQTVLAYSGQRTVNGWATNISAGPPDESGQGLDFIVTTDNKGLFSALPTIDVATGNLTFTPAPNTVGVATVSIQLHDDGGTDNGGVDTSAVQTFTIAVTANSTGFLPPLSQNIYFALGRTIPIKFQLTGANGSLVTSMSAVQSITVSGSEGTFTPPPAAGSTGWRNDGSQYIYNW